MGTVALVADYDVVLTGVAEVACALNQVGVKVPGVDNDTARTRVRNQRRGRSASASAERDGTRLARKRCCGASLTVSRLIVIALTTGAAAAVVRAESWRSSPSLSALSAGCPTK